MSPAFFLRYNLHKISPKKQQKSSKAVCTPKLSSQKIQTTDNIRFHDCRDVFQNDIMPISILISKIKLSRKAACKYSRSTSKEHFV